MRADGVKAYWRACAAKAQGAWGHFPTSEQGLPEEAALRGEARDEVRRLLDGLDPAYRAPIVLRYWYGLSYDEIAETLGITVAAVKSRLHRARLRLAQQATT